MDTQKIILLGYDSLGNPVIQGCIYPWCTFTPGPLHRHSLITFEDRLAGSVALLEKK